MLPLCVLKMGGRAASSAETLGVLIEELKELQTEYRFVFVHGGGAEVTKVSEVFGLKPVFRNGLRQTSAAEMDIVDMVLAGKMNKGLVRQFAFRGVRAVGICGADGDLFLAEPLEAGSRTGRITRVDLQVLILLLGGGYLPVVASVSRDRDGAGLNINADEVALELAKALKAKALLYLSDIPGVLKEGQVLARIDSSLAQQEMQAGVISGGMIPKITSSLEALKTGVGFVSIGEYQKQGDLRALLVGKQGTRIEEKI
ncbi:MAG: acetylglutamate kinase [Spirochaetales bacterium]